MSISGQQEPTLKPSFVDTHLRLLSLLSQGEYEQALITLLGKDFFKKNFTEIIAVLSQWISVPAYSKIIFRLLTSICEHSKDLGNQIIESFLKSNKRDPSIASSLGELITKNTRLASERITKFYHFLLSSLPSITPSNHH